MSEPVNDIAKVNTLSDKEMFTIFNSLPLQDFMQLQLVCKRWKIIHDIVCRSKNDLSLYSRSFINDFRDMSGLLYWSNSVYASKFENYAFCISNKFLVKKRCQLLVAKFPNVKSFSVYGVQIRAKHLYYLLKHWSNLERITLVFDDFEPSDWQAADWNIFWKALNKLKFLKHLALPEFDHQPNGFKSLCQSEVWPRLESVFITVDCDIDAKTVIEMFDCIQPNLKNLTLKNLEMDPFDSGINNISEWENKFKSLLEKKPNVFAQLTNAGFQFEFSGLNFGMLRFICNRFVSLTHLSIDVEFKLSLVEMVPLLAQLRQLTSLRIALEDDMDYEDVDSNYDPSDTENFEPNIGEKNHKNKYNENYGSMRSHGFFSDLTPKTYTKKLTTKLESIRFLYLANFDIFRWDLFNYFRVIFTNVERINFENCEFPLKRKRKNKKLCRRLMLLRALRRFTNLKRIYRNNELLLEIGKITRDKEEAIVENTMKDFFRTKPKYHLEYSTDSDDDDDYDLFGYGYDSDSDFGYGYDDHRYYYANSDDDW